MTKRKTSEERDRFDFYELSRYRGVLMGLQILMIIFFHFTEDCYSSQVRFDGIISFFYNVVKSSGVDVFLLLSGIGLYFSWKKTPDYQVFYVKRFTRILVPYMLCGGVAWILYDMILNEGTILDVLIDFLFVSFFTSGERWLWYILLILGCYVIYPYLFQTMETADDSIAEQMRALTMSVACVCVLLTLKMYHGELYENISILLLRLPVFIWGCLLGKCVYERRKMSYFVLGGWMAFGVFTNVFLQMYDTAILRVYTTTLCNLTICMLVILLLKWFEKKQWNIGVYLKKILEWFGMYSLELYMVHVIVRRVMKVYGFELYRIKYEVLMVGISILIAFVLKKVSEPIIRRLNC